MSFSTNATGTRRCPCEASLVGYQCPQCPQFTENQQEEGPSLVTVVHLFGAFTSLVRISVGFKLQTHEANLISYNATVFQSFSAYDYYVYSVNEAFVNHPGDNLTMIGPYPHIYSGYGPLPLDENVVEKLFNMTHDGELERLDKAQCIDAYAQIFQSSRGDVLLVTPNTTSDLNYTTSEPIIHYERFEVVAQSPYS